MNTADHFRAQGQSRAADAQARDAEFAKQLQQHASQVARRKRALRLYPATAQAAAPQNPLDFLAIGDSWFSYPLDGQLLLPPFDFGIVAPSQLQSMGSPNPTILNKAWPGQASTEALSYENQETMIGLLENGSGWMNGKGPDAILISAGGDDIVGDQFAIYVDYGGKGLSTRFQGVLDLVAASYADLFALRDQFAPGVPIFGHCYDYAQPNGIPAADILGPWLKPSLDFALYDWAAAVQVVRNMIDEFHNLLGGLAAKPENKFYLVDTRNTLTPNNQYPNGWANELHPYPPGFNALANKFLLALQKYFPGRI